MTFGIWLFGVLADRFARWKIFLIYQVGAVVMVIIYAQLRDPTLMLFTGAVMGMFVNGMIGGYGALISDTYPLQVRATAQNVLFNLGRGVGGFGPAGDWSVRQPLVVHRCHHAAGPSVSAGYFRHPVLTAENAGQRRCAGRDRLTGVSASLPASSPHQNNKARVSPGFAHKIAISSRLSAFAGRASNGRNHRR
ncbi:MFS transporter, aromatic acid:H+ symporter (AAHS) family [Raoultella planticola]|uniref:MFS transporter, aromatic acid:H+ symporter (AAHS) family n=1 Tax=Raoultella planticola TaxID=575 RepID=A0A485CTQ8_RAOPL|nr:MFS transporter, aromatic acid:H+ symporter (AAHS) family [Raoultella planticola]